MDVTQHNFQVNLRGLIDVLANNLYSEPRVFVRELLQNAVDALHARELLDPAFKAQREPAIEVAMDEGSATEMPSVTFYDNGIGLTPDEVHAFLASIGASTKRDTEGNRGDFIGQFGVGLLSCFMVTDQIAISTASARDPQHLVRWQGRADGSYTMDIRPNEAAFVGTAVTLHARPDRAPLFTDEAMLANLQHYGSFLPYPITFFGPHEITGVGNCQTLPFDTEALGDLDVAALLELGEEWFGEEFLDAIPLHSPNSGTVGVAFVLPAAPSPAAKGQHRVYLRRMLVSNSVSNILPEWAFFVRCVLNSTGLRPTASREAFYEDQVLDTARRELGECLRAYFVDTAHNRPTHMEHLMAIHHDTLKALAIKDVEFLHIIIDLLKFPSTIGHVTIPEYLALAENIRYCEDLDEFRQIAPIATAQGVPVINAAYTFDSRLLVQMSRVYPDRIAVPIHMRDFLHQLDEISDEDLAQAEFVIDTANEALAEFSCTCEIRRFAPHRLPALYFTSTDMQYVRMAKKSQESGVSGLWAGLLQVLAQELSASASATLCLNLQNSLIAKLVQQVNPHLIRRYVRVLYLQSLLLGHHALNAREQDILHSGLLDLLEHQL